MYKLLNIDNENFEFETIEDCHVFLDNIDNIKVNIKFVQQHLDLLSNLSNDHIKQLLCLTYNSFVHNYVTELKSMYIVEYIIRNFKSDATEPVYGDSEISDCNILFGDINKLLPIWNSLHGLLNGEYKLYNINDLIYVVLNDLNKYIGINEFLQNINFYLTNINVNDPKRSINLLEFNNYNKLSQQFLLLNVKDYEINPLLNYHPHKYIKKYDIFPNLNKEKSYTIEGTIKKTYIDNCTLKNIKGVDSNILSTTSIYLYGRQYKPGTTIKFNAFLVPIGKRQKKFRIMEPVDIEII